MTEFQFIVELIKCYRAKWYHCERVDVQTSAFSLKNKSLRAAGMAVNSGCCKTNHMDQITKKPESEHKT